MPKVRIEKHELIEKYIDSMKESQKNHGNYTNEEIERYSRYAKEDIGFIGERAIHELYGLNSDHTIEIYENTCWTLEKGDIVETVHLQMWESFGAIETCKYIANHGIVERVTEKQIIVKNEHGNESRFWKNGKAVGSGDLGFYAVRKAQTAPKPKKTKVQKLLRKREETIIVREDDLQEFRFYVTRFSKHCVFVRAQYGVIKQFYSLEAADNWIEQSVIGRRVSTDRVTGQTDPMPEKCRCGSNAFIVSLRFDETVLQLGRLCISTSQDAPRELVSVVCRDCGADFGTRFEGKEIKTLFSTRRSTND